MNTIVVILVAILLIVLYNTDTNEKFQAYLIPTIPSFYCSNCGWMNRRKCADCANCGFCFNSRGVGECVSGDNKGPYFRKDCAVWEYAPPTIVAPTYSYSDMFYGGNPTYYIPRRSYRNSYRGSYGGRHHRRY
jgi:hypothetical protein